MRSTMRETEQPGGRLLPLVIVLAALVALASLASVRRPAPPEPLLLGWVQR